MARHSSPLLLAAALAVLLLPHRTEAAVTLIEDNFIWKGTPTAIQDSNASLTIKGPAPSQGNARTIYLKFDLTGHTIAEGNFADLTLTSVTTASNPPTSFSFALYALNTGGAAWTESTINWANSPGLGTGTFDLSNTATTFLGNFNTLPAGYASGSPISVSFADWDNYRQADNTLTLIIVGTAQSDAGPSISFASSENGNAAIRPTLNLSAVPEPSRSLLGLLSLSVIICLRRRPSARL
ncbi:DNRLRE domain-containing protein [Phragmitibacter flavus]|nr:DNRLRE domain-containing protein [Phragmitibacter flavus]